MSTCEEGILAEHARLGASYADVINERLGRAGPQSKVAGTLQLLEEMRASCERARQATLKLRAQTDQTKAHTRDLKADAANAACPECGTVPTRATKDVGHE